MHLALTGGIGCGKSTALTIFRNLGAKTFDCDDVVHELYRQKDVLDVLIERWGDSVVSQGELNREFVADIIFEDHSQRQWLNEFIHPRVRQEIKKNLSEDVFNITAVPLLYERGMAKEYDQVITIWSPYSLQLQRLQARGWGSTEINRRLDAQISADEKLERANLGLINDGSIEHLKAQCEMLWHQFN